jgi:hypothetical protein
MATTLDEEFRKVLRDHAAGANKANERYALNTIRIVAANMDGDEEIWTLSPEDAEKRARKYRLMAAYALRGAAICDDHAQAHASPDLATAIESVRAVLHVE